MPRSGICCAGNWIIDHVKTITFWPQEETLTNIIAQEIGTGGSPYNVLVDLARFQAGVPLCGIGLVGDDWAGRRILEDMGRLGIDARQLRVEPGRSTAYTDVMAVQGTGRRTFFHHRGANALLGPEHFDPRAVSAKIFHLGYLLLLDTLDEPDAEHGTKAARVLAAFQREGIETSLDVVSEDSDRFARIVTPALAHVDYCIINEIEAGRTTGIEIRAGGRLRPDAMKAAAEEIQARGVRRWVVVHTPELSYGRTREGQERWQPSHRLGADWIQGTVGAGDAFLAGALLGAHEGWGLERSLRFAAAAAATCLRHPTTTGGVGALEEIQRLCGSLPYQDLPALSS